MDLPKISFIIPTLNAAGVLPACLDSIRRQDYPQDRVEILVADGGSTDGTRELAARSGATVLDNPGRGYDTGKCVGLAAATGEFVVFVDADNELSHPDFLTQSINALQKYPQALGLESYYPPSPKMGSFCVYLTHLLHISDPVAWMISVRPVPVAVDGVIERWTFPENSFAYPMGANGFIFRRTDLAHLGKDDKFEDTAVVLDLARQGRREWLRVTGCGVHHYVVSGLKDFIKKRRRQAFHFLNLRGQGPVSWTRLNPAVPSWLACLYCATLVGPFYHTLTGLIRTRHPAWLWHPVACLASVFGIAWGVLTYMTLPKDDNNEARLQPIQKLTK